MISRLTALYELQLIDEQLDELEELRGDLPTAVNELVSKINGIKNSVDLKEKEMQAAKERKTVIEEERLRATENLKRYKAQLYQVRNNKEYDALTKEIDQTEENIKKLDAENLQIVELLEKLEVEILEITPQLTKLTEELKEKEDNLKQIIKANEREEQKLREIREKVVEKVKKPDYVTYTRIRKALGGRAVVPIVRGSCDGCHNIIPSQRQIEIKSNKRMFNCEACGRIIVSQEIVDAVKK